MMKIVSLSLKSGLLTESESMCKRIHEVAPRVSLVKGERDVRSEVTSA